MNARAVASRVGIGEHEMVGLALGLARVMDGVTDRSDISDGSVVRFPDLGGPTLGMEA